MCGIAGMIGVAFDPEIAEKMLGTMLHRGPDGNGIYMKKDCALLHSRLAVIDPAGGKQPMVLAQGEQKYVIIYNGELYNAPEIRCQLKDCGHMLRTHSDTELVLLSFIEWKEQALEKLNGIFAFAIWEEGSKSLFLARDRMGVKPLFYKEHMGGLLFASEIKTILAYPTVSAQIDSEGAAQLLLLGPGRRPGSGVFRGIKELEPGWCGWFRDGCWQTKRYWKLKDREHTDDFVKTTQRVRHLVVDAIQRQMVSDVPIGTFLSGGLDSSIITAVCNQYSQKPLPAFSLDYRDNARYFRPGKFQPDTDNAYIEIMRQNVSAEHHWTVLTPEELIAHMESATRARDLPGMADVDFSLQAFCGQIRQHVTVALSGECADEIFGGYPWYRDPQVLRQQGFPWAQNSFRRAAFLQPDILGDIEPNDYVQDLYRQTVEDSDILPGTGEDERRMKEMINLNQRWFMQTLLDRKDRMSMFTGLEVRVPFCDYRIAEYLYGVPWHMKEYNGVEKGLLRKSMEGLLPDEILWRKKSPYPKTYDPEYFRLVSEQLDHLLEQNDAPIYALVQKEELRKLLREDNGWPWYGQLMQVPQTIAYMLQLDLWMRIYQVSFV